MENKVICSRYSLDSNYELINEFLNYIDDLINFEEVQKLKEYSQHMKTSRYQHSLNVAYYTFLICRKLKLNVYSATRGALLHDLYFYNWRNSDEKPKMESHPNAHPKIALYNAKKLIEVDKVMEDCIINHMWPMTKQKPKTKEGIIVQAVDKYCACLEICNQTKNKIAYNNIAIVFICLFSVI